MPLGRPTDVVAAYKTVFEHDNELEKKLARATILTFTSASAVNGFVHALGTQLAEAVDGKRVACIGPVTAQAAEAAGLHVDHVASAFTIEGLIEALQRRTRLMSLLIGVIAAALIALAALRARSLTPGGALAAFVVGGVTFGIGGLPGAVLLLAFFISSVALTRVGRERKRALTDIAKSGPRDAAQVLANGGIATLCVGLPRRSDGKSRLVYRVRRRVRCRDRGYVGHGDRHALAQRAAVDLHGAADRDGTLRRDERRRHAG